MNRAGSASTSRSPTDERRAYLMTRVMAYTPFAVVVERDGWRRTDPIYVRGALIEQISKI